MNVIFDRGIHLAELGLWLDGRVKRAEGYISHAHADHVARHSRAFMTTDTQRLLGPLLKRTDCHVLDYGEVWRTRRFEVTLLPAGHCLGSSQVLVTSRETGERTLYTGDLKLKPNPTAPPPEPVTCDTLIIEATYGQPQYVFPPQEQVLRQCTDLIATWLSQGLTPVVIGYRVGKAQEVLHHLLSEGFDVALEPSLYQATEAYQEAGVSFPGYFTVLNDRPREGQVVIRPPGKKIPQEIHGSGARTMALTGWAVDGVGAHWHHADALLPFSDHADFGDLVSYVQAVRPRRVYTVFGFPQLASHLRKMGWNATHLVGLPPRGQQLSLL